MKEISLMPPFESFGLSPIICNNLSKMGYTKPTSIQEQAIPLVLRGLDVIASAQTGTGKTASFLLPIIEILLSSSRKQRAPRSVILVPTRELATQVFQNFSLYAQDASLIATTLVGGESITQQQKLMRAGVDVLIATPGRLIDLLERDGLLFFDVRCIVIDEADRMLDMGFIPDINKILSYMPKTKQTLMFSATFPPEIQNLTESYMVLPRRIEVSPEQTTSFNIEQYIVRVNENHKRKALRYIIEQYGCDLGTKKPVIVFSNRKKNVDILTQSLKRHHFAAASLHGDLNQSVRNETLESFREKKTHIIVASDVAARGIDVDQLGLVINFDVPLHAEDYVHRIGRTGRAGQTGMAFTFVDPKENKKLNNVIKLIGKELTEYHIPKETFEEQKAALVKQKSSFKGFGDLIPNFFKIPILGWECPVSLKG